ncbi:MAG: chromosome segregation protein SMC [Sulfobacillus acidophilus]|uniref:Chromosome partition protein Smc n=1 Tax=Sulfobacillus acidophilus TaxID=53633 RepID=A0A2T2WHX3_9FIRM|nr:MAG: chromosome segregation protein SMC [Sulfobacillus acidophilus]
MFLRRIRIYGFKSFAQEVVIELEPGITALVGPNGGGKSNVVDAIRWALGEQRLRDLRAERWDDLLHQGGGGRAGARLAEVSLQFDNQDGEMAAWPESLEVARRYYRSGDAEYLVNGQTVRLKDLTDLFLDSGIGRFSYAIISQGRVEDALLQRPADRLEQLEEAAGVSRYKVRKKETLAHLRETDAKLVRLDDLLQEVGGQIEAVREQAELESRYRDQEARRQDWQRRLMYTEYRRAQDRQTRHRQQVEHWQKERLDLKDQLGQVSDEIQALESTLPAQSAWVQEQVARLAGLRENETALKVQKTEKEGQLGRLGRERELVGQALTETTEREQQLADELDQVEGSEQGSPSVEINVDGAREAFHRAHERWEHAKAARQQCEQKLQTLAQERARLNERLARMQGVLGLGGDEKELVVNLSARQAKCAELQREVDGLAQEAAQLAEERNRLKQLVAKLEQELYGLRRELAGHQARLSALQQLEMDGEGLSVGVRAVLRGHREGQLTGVMGTLQSLIQITDDMTVAVETALGASHQDLVMRSEKEARAAVRFLKTGGVGRATFLPLDTVSGARVPSLEAQRLRQEEGVVGWAADLVECSESVRPAVQHVLGRVLIVQDLDDASRLGPLHRFRYKMVTVDGQIVHAGGAITGGSRVNSRTSGRSRKIEVAELARRVHDDSDVLAQREKVLQTTRDKVEGLDRTLDAVRDQLADRRHQWQELRKTLEAFQQGDNPAMLAAEVRSLQDTEAKAQAQLALLVRDEAAAAQAMDEAEAQFKAAQAAWQRVSQEQREQGLIAERIRSELSRIGGQRQRHQDRLAELLAEESAAGLELAHIQAQLDQIEEQVLQQEAARVERAQDLQKRSERLSTLQARQRVLESEDRKMEHKVEMLQHEIREIEVRFEHYDVPEALEPLTRPQEEEARSEIARITAELQTMGSVVLGSLALYEQLQERAVFLQHERDDVKEAKAELSKTLEEIDQEMKRRVKDTGAKVELAFAQACHQLYGGGDGGFTWAEGDNAGVDLWVRPSGKRPSHLGLLSGGEKALGGIAWLFSLLSVRPSPFVVLDEVEASLDEANAMRFAQYIRGQRQTTQYVVVTHQRETMEAADALWGVASNGQGQSLLVSVRLTEPAEMMQS